MKKAISIILIIWSLTAVLLGCGQVPAETTVTETERQT